MDDNIIVDICFAGVVFIYFYNNPMKHGRWFMMRRFINWLPLGMTYAFLYMGRYNLNVAKNALGPLMTNEEFGWIGLMGSWVYALSFLINGPLVDRFGGKLGIIVAALGSSFANVLLGVLTWMSVTHRLNMRLAVPFAVLYALNMYFQSFGAISIIKVKAYWFHVRERGVFSAVFGSLISIGGYFAFDWGQAVADMTKVKPEGKIHWLQNLMQSVFSVQSRPEDAIWSVFYVPAAIMVFWVILDWWLILDTPEEANFLPFEVADASTGEMHLKFTAMDLLKKVFASRLMIMIALVALTVGISRNGILSWYKVFAKEVHDPGSQYYERHWGLLLCVFGIVGGFIGGWLSDAFFQSRRAPPAVLLCGVIFLTTIVMAVYLHASAATVALSSLMIFLASIGVQSLMASTAAADFGGRKATATASGIVDGFVYLGSGIQFVGVSQLMKFPGHWYWWPLFMMPFAVLGVGIAMSIWHELPEATRRYIAEVESKATDARERAERAGNVQ